MESILIVVHLFLAIGLLISTDRFIRFLLVPIPRMRSGESDRDETSNPLVSCWNTVYQDEVCPN